MNEPLEIIRKEYRTIKTERYLTENSLPFDRDSLIIVTVRREQEQNHTTNIITFRFPLDVIGLPLDVILRI